jgi:2-dehydropantoate 2-reductase
MRRYVICGAGAIGGTIGALLFEHGENVVFIARGAHGAAIAEFGLQFETPDRNALLPVPAVENASQLTFSGDDVILLAVKLQDSLEALHSLAEMAPRDTPVVCLQNGVEGERMALRIFSNVYGSLVFIPASHLVAGSVRLDSAPSVGVLDVGRYPSGESELALELAETFKSATVDAIARHNIMEWKYAKLKRNLNNAATAIFGLNHPYKDITAKLVAEATQCFEAAGIKEVLAEEFQARIVRVSRTNSQGEHKIISSSTWQSLERGAGRVETDYLNGEIVLLGRLYGIPTPANELAQRLTAELALRKVPPGAISGHDFAQLLEAYESS